MRQQHDIHLVEIEIEFADFDERAGSRINEEARSALDQNNVTGFAAAGRARPARTKHDQFEWSRFVGDPLCCLVLRRRRFLGRHGREFASE